MFNLSLRNLPLPLIDQAKLKTAIEESLKLFDLKINYVQDQLFPSSANETYVLIHAAIRGILRKEATRAIGEISFPSPITLPEGSRLLSSDGREYKTTRPLENGTKVPIESLEAGLRQNLPPGESLRLLSPIGFISSGTITEEGVLGGSDIETIESLRIRTLEKWRSNTEYGSPQNYDAWLKESALFKAGVFPSTPVPGYVSWSGLLEASPGDYALPSPEVIKSVNALLDQKRPPGVKILFQSQSRVTKVNVTIRSNVSLSEVEKTEIEKALRELFIRRAFPFGAYGFEEELPLSENLLRLTLFQFLGEDRPFELTLSPEGKLGSSTLSLGEYLLLGRLAWA